MRTFEPVEGERTVHTLLEAPRVNRHGAIAWVEAEGCGEEGSLLFHSDGETVEVDQLVLDSLCVGHIAVPGKLILTDELLVWSDLERVSYAQLRCSPVSP